MTFEALQRISADRSGHAPLSTALFTFDDDSFEPAFSLVKCDFKRSAVALLFGVAMNPPAIWKVLYMAVLASYDEC